jgi:hypothetical protein
LPEEEEEEEEGEGITSTPSSDTLHFKWFLISPTGNVDSLRSSKICRADKVSSSAAAGDLSSDEASEGLSSLPSPEGKASPYSTEPFSLGEGPANAITAFIVAVPDIGEESMPLEEGIETAAEAEAMPILAISLTIPSSAPPA